MPLILPIQTPTQRKLTSGAKKPEIEAGTGLPSGPTPFTPVPTAQPRRTVAPNRFGQNPYDSSISPAPTFSEVLAEPLTAIPGISPDTSQLMSRDPIIGGILGTLAAADLVGSLATSKNVPISAPDIAANVQRFRSLPLEEQVIGGLPLEALPGGFAGGITQSGVRNLRRAPVLQRATPALAAGLGKRSFRGRTFKEVSEELTKALDELEIWSRRRDELLNKIEISGGGKLLDDGDIRLPSTASDAAFRDKYDYFDAVVEVKGRERTVNLLQGELESMQGPFSTRTAKAAGLEESAEQAARQLPSLFNLRKVDQIASLRREVTRGMRQVLSGGDPPTSISSLSGISLTRQEAAVEKLTNVLTTARRNRGQITRAQSAARSSRAGSFAAVRTQLGGEEGARKAAAQLRGRLAPTDFPEIRSALSGEEINDIHDLIGIRLLDKAIRPFDARTADTAFYKLLSGDTPTVSEIRALRRALGPDVAKAIEDLRGIKGWEILMEALNLPRAIKTTFDMSAPLRQGLVLAAGHPTRFLGAWVPMTKAFFSPRHAQLYEDAIRAHTLFDLSQEVGLFIAERGGALSAREETFISRFLTDFPFLPKFARGIAQRISPVAASERAYVTFLNKFRIDVFGDVAARMIREGATDRDLQQLAHFVNAASGRGNLPQFMQSSTPFLNALFFSPRFQASRIELAGLTGRALTETLTSPLGAGRVYTTLHPTVRKLIIKDMLAFIGSGLTALSLIAYAFRDEPNVSVGNNPLNSRFGKIRIGPVEYDFWAGYAPLARFVMQFAKAQRENPTDPTKFPVDANRWELVDRFIRSKLAPGPGFARDVLQGQTFLGEQQDLRTSQGLLDTARRQFLPMYLEDTLESMQEMGWIGAPMAAPSFFGVGIVAYQNIGDTRNDVSREIYNQEYYQLDQNQKGIVDTDSRVTVAIQEFKDSRPPMPRNEQVQANLAAYNQTKEALAPKLASDLSTLEPGEQMRELIQDYQTKVAGAGESFIDQDTKDYLRGNREIPMVDYLRDAYRSVPLETDPDTGEPDYLTFNHQRDQWLAYAKYIGISEEEITAPSATRFPEAVRPQLEAIFQEYEQDMQALQPYWEAGRGFVGTEKQNRREEEIIRNPELYGLLLKWDYRFLPGQTRVKEVVVALKERGLPIPPELQVTQAILDEAEMEVRRRTLSQPQQVPGMGQQQSQRIPGMGVQP